MHSDDVVISVRNVSKVYRLFDHPGDRVKQFATFGMKKYHREFTALQDVSFDVRRGETVGIIGRNGAGKSTLLQIICGIMKPTQGKVTVRGRVSALLELGAGFNPEFTGRENVYFHGTLMGYSKAQMDKRYDEIVVFADIGEFIDQPVRTYSSGMFVRLAFAVAVHLDPDVLVVDEALGVGDIAFQAKCLRKIDDIRCTGGTVVLVSHVLEQVAHHCERAVHLNNGLLVRDGEVSAVLQGYLGRTHEKQLIGTEESPEEVPVSSGCYENHPAYQPSERRWGDGKAAITGVEILQNGKWCASQICPGERTVIRATIRFYDEVSTPVYGIMIKTERGEPVFSVNSRELGAEDAHHRHAGDQVTISFTLKPLLNTGTYVFSFGVASQALGVIAAHDRRYDSLRIELEWTGVSEFGSASDVFFEQNLLSSE